MTASPTSRLAGLDAASIPDVIATAEALEAGKLADAARRIAGVASRYPDHPEVLRLVAGIESLAGRHAEAIAAMRRALAQRPDDALYFNTLGTVLAEAGEYDGAIDALRRCCEMQPTLALAWYNLGVLLVRCVRYDDAADALREAVRLAPDHVGARALLADMLRVGNRPADAAAEYRRLLAQQPYAGAAWWGLADLKTLKLSHEDVAKIRASLGDKRASDDDRIAMGFTLAKALDDEGRYAESLAALAEANAIARQRRSWNATAFAGGMAAIRAAFLPPPSPADASLGDGVIFIASLPRSGSTLIEQILASHSAVEGAGELADLPLTLAEESKRRGAPFPHWVGAMTPDDWQRLGTRYLERTSYWRRRRTHFTDKLPNNWYYFGAIRAMLPGARIVGVRRDPLETCFSCYRQFLYNNEYQRTFDDLAGFWREFDANLRLALAQHPSRVLESVYEDLIAEPETHIRRLLDFCDLPFEAACLEFHRTERDVRSPSAMQVRQPLRRDTARTERYGALLDPLRDALANVIADPTRGVMPSLERQRGAASENASINSGTNGA
jgi:tetratricopeptide (TPR) repeat protein